MCGFSCAAHSGGNHAASFVGGDLLFLLEGEGDVVQPLDETLLAEGVDLEFPCAARAVGERLISEVHRQLNPFLCLDLLENLIDGALVKLDRQQAMGALIYYMVDSATRIQRREAPKAFWQPFVDDVRGLSDALTAGRLEDLFWNE